jgi:SAM-dependent methyltransferase
MIMASLKTNNLSDRIRKSFAFRLSRIGEYLGIDSLIYNYFMMLEFHEHGLREAPNVIECILSCYPHLNKVLDVGSGSGVFSAEFNKRGVSAVAIEHSHYGRKLAIKQGVNCYPFDLNLEPPADLDGEFDLIYCFEIAEHLPPSTGRNLIKFLTSFNKIVLFTAAHPGQGGIGHINEQPKEYWISLFQEFKYKFNEHETNSLKEKFYQANCSFWFPKNIIVLQPKT